MSVFVNNLDDFILPSQDCINPFILSKNKDSQQQQQDHDNSSSNSKKSRKILLSTDDTISEYENYGNPLTSNTTVVEPNLINVKYDSNNKKIASVSLNDCLACSGCITSAEAILIQEQSYNKLLEVLQFKEKMVVVSLSPQSVASLAGYLNLTQTETFLKIATHLKGLGVQYVLDTSSGEDISLLESRREFLERRQFGKGSQWIRPPTSMAFSNTRVILPNEAHDARDLNPVPLSELNAMTSALYNNNDTVPFSPLPMFCSHCPGWVCYAEKTHPQCLPYISRAKSAQQILGSIFKHILTQPSSIVEYAVQNESASSWTPQQVFHVSIQPCFDKKLEASRLDFFDESTGVQDVDLVISSSELWMLIEQTFSHSGSGENLSPVQSFKSLQCDSPTGRDSIEKLFRSYSLDSYQILSSVTSQKNSNGYAEYLFRYLAMKLFSIDLSNQEIHYIVGRNQDIAEAVLYSNGTTVPQDIETAKPLLRFARIYGFRNIQGIILKMKRSKCDYDYVEIMACPSGCINGGGQIKLTTNETPAEIQTRVTQTSTILHSNLLLKTLEHSPLVQYLYNSDPKDEELTTPFSQYFRTQYHAIPKLELMVPMASKW